jgi:NADH-quinone oxidoreductase subunit F
LVAPVRILQEDGRVSGVELCRMALGEFDRSGRKKPEPTKGKKLKIKADTVISAVSQEAELELLEGCDVFTDGSRIRVDRLQGTENPRVFAGGDVVTGPAMVIDAIRAGQDAARSIDEFLRAKRGEPAWVPPPGEEIEIPSAVEREAVECPQTPMPELSARSRRRDFREVEKGYTRKMALNEACRCQRCDAEAD